MTPAGTSTNLTSRINEMTTHTQCEWHRMTGMTGPDCAVICNLINTHTHTHIWEDQRESHRMTRMTRPDCAVMCNLINTHTHTHTHTHIFSWHRMTRMTRPDCAVMCNLINTHTHTRTHTQHIDPPLGGSMQVA